MKTIESGRRAEAHRDERHHRQEAGCGAGQIVSETVRITGDFLLTDERMREL
jgi:hypothetical protein